jgi:hypothetical protein
MLKSDGEKREFQTPGTFKLLDWDSSYDRPKGPTKSIQLDINSVDARRRVRLGGDVPGVIIACSVYHLTPPTIAISKGE